LVYRPLTIQTLHTKCIQHHLTVERTAHGYNLIQCFFLPSLQKNGTDTITIPAGKWNASLYLQSEAMTASLIGDGEDLIFHFEDGSGGNPDNSESDSTRDLENCGGGGSTWGPTQIATDTDDAEMDDPSK